MSTRPADGRDNVSPGPDGERPAAQHLAQLNIGRLRYEVNDPRMADFVDNLAFVNGLAERSTGFVWRYQDDSGAAIETRPFDGDPRMAINLSVWENVEALERFVWQTVHKRFYGRRHDWFEATGERYFVMWWVAAGHRPSVQEAIERLDHLRRHGPSEHAFGWESLPAAKLWKEARCA